jgi:hypothetical protein
MLSYITFQEARCCLILHFRKLDAVLYYNSGTSPGSTILKLLSTIFALVYQNGPIRTKYLFDSVTIDWYYYYF